MENGSKGRENAYKADAPKGKYKKYCQGDGQKNSVENSGHWISPSHFSLFLQYHIKSNTKLIPC